MIKIKMSLISVYNSRGYKTILPVLQIRPSGFITGLKGFLFILLTFTFAQFSYVHVAAPLYNTLMKSVLIHEFSGTENEDNAPASPALVSHFDLSGQLICIRTETCGGMAAGKFLSLHPAGTSSTPPHPHSFCSSIVRASQSAWQQPNSSIPCMERNVLFGPKYKNLLFRYILVMLVQKFVYFCWQVLLFCWHK